MSDPAPSHGHSHGEAHASRPPAHLNMGAEMAFDHTTYDDHSMTAVLAREQANALRRKGVKGSLLDFGTGTGGSPSLHVASHRSIGADGVSRG